MAFAESKSTVLGWPNRLLFHCRCAVEPKVLRTNALIALFVGVVLSAANQFDVIRSGQLSPRLMAKLATNFAVPFVVSTVSAVLNRRTPAD